MGWFGYSPLEGEPGMDFQDELGCFLGINFSEETDNLKVASLLQEKTTDILDFLRDFDWNQFKEPGMTQFFYIQALFQNFIDYNVPITERMYTGGIVFITTDKWAEVEPKRKEAMDKLFREVTNNYKLNKL